MTQQIDFSKIVDGSISTSETKRPERPSLTIKSPLDADVFLSKIDLMPNDAFSLKGNLIIEANNLKISPDDYAFFTGMSKYPLPLGIVLKRGNVINFYGWNDTDSSLLGCDVKCFFDSVPKNYDNVSELTTARPLTGTALNSTTNLIYTCPQEKKARIYGSVALEDYGAASRVDLTANGVPVEFWILNSGGTPDRSYDSVALDSFYGQVAGQSASKYRKREIDISIAAGQELRKIQNVGNNATLYYTLKLLESRA